MARSSSSRSVEAFDGSPPMHDGEEEKELDEPDELDSDSEGKSCSSDCGVRGWD